MADKPRYALYTRISKDPTGQSTAPARQEKECRALAKERGFEIVDVYTDTDLSAYRDIVRPQYEEMLEAMADGAYDGVIVWKLDRLVRRIVEFSRFWKIASENSVALISKNDSLDTTSPIGVGIVHLIVALAEQESYNTSLRLKAKERELAELGRHKHAGRRAYGMKEGWEEIEPAEAAIIREAADRLLAGDSITSIVRDLNDRGVPSATGGRWNRRSLTVLMQQARLFGWREHNGVLVAKGNWPAILEEDTGHKLRALLEPRAGKGGTATPRKYLLSGLLRCGKCGARMKSGSSSQQGARYACPTKTEGGCGGTVIMREAADQAVSEMVLYRLDSPNVRAMLKARTKTKRRNQDAEILAELAQLTERSEELAEMWASGELPRAAFVKAQQTIDERTEALNEQLATIRQAEPLAGLGRSATAVRKAWENMSTDRRRAVLDAVLERVVVHGNGSAWYRERLREALLAEAEEAEAAGDRALARRRRKQAESRAGGGGSFRPERLEPIWRV